MKQTYNSNLLLILFWVILGLGGAYLLYKQLDRDKTPEKVESINLGMSLSDTEEKCLNQLDSLKQLNDKLQYKYDSLLLFCDPVVEVKPVTPKKKAYTKKVTKVDTVKVKDTALADSLSKELLTCRQINDELTNALIAIDSINKELYLVNSELAQPRVSDLVNGDIAINTAAYLDTTVYAVKVFPDLSASLVRIKRPFLSITPRKFVVTVKENNKYATEAKPLVKEFIRKQIPKVKGNHRIAVK
jgi:hypothetical protein